MASQSRLVGTPGCDCTDGDLIELPIDRALRLLRAMD